MNCHTRDLPAKTVFSCCPMFSVPDCHLDHADSSKQALSCPGRLVSPILSGSVVFYPRKRTSNPSKVHQNCQNSIKTVKWSLFQELCPCFFFRVLGLPPANVQQDPKVQDRVRRLHYACPPLFHVVVLMNHRGQSRKISIMHIRDIPKSHTLNPKLVLHMEGIPVSFHPFRTWVFPSIRTVCCGETR